jgi:hypothetical protein
MNTNHSKPVSTTNSFEGLEEEITDNTSTNVGKIAKSPPIFIAKVNNVSSFSQSAAGEHEIKIIS